LFGIFEQERLIGGFGVRRRVFCHDGPVSFIPHTGGPLMGFLRYGSVIEPSLRGRGRFQIASCQLLQTFGDEGLYSISRNPESRANLPYERREVGHANGYTGYHLRLRRADPRAADNADTPAAEDATPQSCGAPESHLARVLQLTEQRLVHSAAEIAAAKQQIARLTQELRELQALRQEHRNLLRSRSWRLTAPCRQAAGMVRRLGRRAS
jgi:hypothetical protein